MANSKRSIRTSRRNTTNPSPRQLKALLNAWLPVVQRMEDPAPSPKLTRSQRLRLNDLATATGISADTWLRRAVEIFLRCEAIVWTDVAARKGNSRPALKLIRR